VPAKHETSPGVTAANMPPGTTTDLFLYVPQPTPTYPKPPLGGATAGLELPSAAEAGTTLRYVVDITNPSPRAFTWGKSGVASVFDQ